ncbi:MAG TPA: glycoside hydrolase family 18 protein [Chitinophagaceae bacterium]|nr:glycoside hydrolase family 18 protein [Chitinophagaceae bacterium]
MNRFIYLLILSAFAIIATTASGQKNNQPFTIIAYYAGGPAQVDSFDTDKLTHIIFSFCHLKGNRLNVHNARDTQTIQKLVGLKKNNPKLKVLLSLGGWGGCETCSDVFSTAANRQAFARSVKELNNFFGTDGIDLDWEYPTIPGYPGHKYQPADKQHFTELVKQLRQTLGTKTEVSFAAGGFPKFLQESVDWKEVMKYCDRVNLMTYDLVHGFDTVTGHHTALYSTSRQLYSTDNAVKYLVSIGIPPSQLVIGAAFYARIWENVPPANNGLYQPGKFKTSVGFRDFPTKFSADSGFVWHWDSTARAPYLYNAAKKLFATGDDLRSIREKTRYALDNGLNGIMFWQLTHDTRRNGLVNEIFTAVNLR